MKYSKTWIKVKFDNSIELIEHPLTGILIPKIEFAEEFDEEFDEGFTEGFAEGS